MEAPARITVIGKGLVDEGLFIFVILTVKEDDKEPEGRLHSIIV